MQNFGICAVMSHAHCYESDVASSEIESFYNFTILHYASVGNESVVALNDFPQFK